MTTEPRNDRAVSTPGIAPARTARPAVRMPSSPPIPKTLQAVLAVLYWREFIAWLTRRYGAAFTIHVPIFGTVVVVTEPELVKQVFLADPAELGVLEVNQISRLVGPGSVFALNGAWHRQRRDLLGPPLHGKQVRAHEPMLIAETLAEIASWPDGAEFETYAPMLRITLNAILHAVYGATGAELDELRLVVPPMVRLGSRLAILPKPARAYGRFTPWGRLVRWRTRYEAVVDELIATLCTDPAADERTDLLAVLARRNTDGTVRSGLSRAELGDELLGLAAAGHETAAATLSWVFERISRHPELLVELTAEDDAGGSALRRATIREVQRTRSPSGYTGRCVYAPTFRLGEWVIPRGTVIRVAIGQVHRSATAFPDPDRFDPHRFLDGSPSAFEWIPFGGGTRHCPGSAFAGLEMDVVVRTVLQHFTIEPTTAPGEKWHSRGVAYAPRRGGRIVVHRRPRSASHYRP